MKKKYLRFTGIALAAMLSASSLVTVFADAESFDTGEAIEDPSLIETGTKEEASLDSLSDNDLLSGEATYTVSGIKTAPKLSRGQIAARYQETFSDSAINVARFSADPNPSAPYATGAVSSEHLNLAINTFNLMRALAGVGEASMSEVANDYAQYGAVVMAANDSLSHKPSRPAGMEDYFYNKGYSAASSSNISMGYPSSHYPLQRFIKNCMDDSSSSSNIQCLGHRRWIIYPDLTSTGFGYATSADGSAYGTTKVMGDGVGRNSNPGDYDFIAWPSSGDFPNELVDARIPWSVTLNRNVFKNPNASDISVTITTPSGEIQTVNQSTSGGVTTKTEPYFTVNLDGYGVSNCIIFRPGTGILGSGALNGNYKVTITGIKTRSGENATLSYDVNFFSANATAPDPNGGGGNQRPVDRAKVEAFVSRLYTIILARDAEAAGLNDWTNQLVSGQKNGADVAEGFVLSTELKNKNISDEEYVERMYLTFLGRASDAGGKADWTKKLRQGYSRRFVAAGFVNSQEFTNICNQYGITRGTLTADDSRSDENLHVDETKVSDYVDSLYSNILKRSADAAGKNDWVNRIKNHEMSAAEVARIGFFTSPEYLNKNTSNEQFLTDIYAAFFNRQPDSEGYNYWLARMSQGYTRDQVILEGFGQSLEFNSILRSYGLKCED